MGSGKKGILVASCLLLVAGIILDPSLGIAASTRMTGKMGPGRVTRNRLTIHSSNNTGSGPRETSPVHGLSVVALAKAEAPGPVPLAPSPKILSLEDCVLYAIRNSYEVKLAKLDLYISETGVMYREAVFDTFLFGAASYAEDKRQQLSVFSADDSQSNEYSVGITKTAPTGTDLTVELQGARDWTNSGFVSKNPSHETELSMTAAQPVGKNFFGYTERSTITLAKLAVKNADLETADRIEKLIADVEKSYWNLAHKENALSIYKDILDKARELHEKNKKNNELGLLETVDLIASEANVAVFEAGTVLAENDYKRAGENLKLIMNYESDMSILSSKASAEPEFKGGIDDYLERAFRNRRDYMIKTRDVEIKGLNLKIKENNKWPEIDLKGTLAFNGLETDPAKALGKTFVNDNVYYYAGVEVNVPIENREARSEYKKAGYEKEKSVFKLKETERAIITEVVNEYNDVLAYGNSLAFSEKARSLEAMKLEEEEKRFGYGRSSTKRLIDYQQDLLNADLDKENDLFEYRKAKVELERAVNSILSKYGDKI